jgi:hypothetical protein
VFVHFGCTGSSMRDLLFEGDRAINLGLTVDFREAECE